MGRRSKSDPQPRPALSRESVLRAALDLADERGIDALTMRELGQRLGVEAMSLYNHVENKDDLLDGLVDLVVGEIDLPSGDVGWREAMHRRAVSAHEVFARHPWSIVLIDSRESSGPERMRYFDWVIGTLRRAGFSVKLAVYAFSAIDSYVYGFGRQQLNLSTPGADSRQTAQAFLTAIPADRYPHLCEVITEYILPAGYDESADFEFGLGLILDSLERILADGRPG